MQIRFDNGPDGTGAVFDAPIERIIAETPQEVVPALAALDRALADGHWVAGFATYEMGFALEPRLMGRMPTSRRMPLMCFGVYEGHEGCVGPGGGRSPALPDFGETTTLIPLWSEVAYATAFARVHHLIGAGDIYQANLTFPLVGKTDADPEALYDTLAASQPVGYGALVQADDLPAILCRSPELFFRTDASGQIETRPMKGTQPRGATPQEDAANRTFLETDPKNRAENLMIVDLLRNDMSRIAVPGSVHVPDLFKVETYATVHQMTSLVQAQLRDRAGLADIFTALFPCGSITGAPKLRAMEILSELEPAPRDIYCGSIGWAAPDGRSEFNVAIRTLLVENREVTLNVGGGVVWDSTTTSEYEEALWKTRFASPSQMIFA